MYTCLHTTSASPWGLLDDLLVAALDGALALVQVDGITMLVTQHLDLNVTRVVNELLNQHAIITKAGLGLILGQAEPLPGEDKTEE